MNKLNLEKVRLTAAKMDDVCLRFDAQILLLGELIAKLEAENSNNYINLRTKKRN